MERLRIAIEKARTAREQGGPDTRPAAPSRAPGIGRAANRPDGASAGGTPGLEAAWSALTPFQPRAKQLERSRIVSAHGDRQATEFDKLRTRIVQQMQARGWRRLAVTSPGPGCGKSTVTLNLGFGLARRESNRIVICEMDLRRPSLARLLGLPGRADIARVLQGVDPFEAHAVRVGGNLAVATARGSRSQTAELLQDPSTAAALEEIEAAYDPSVLLLDTSPVMVSDDTIGLLGHADCALIVAAAGTTTIAEIDACEREVAAQTQVLGVVLNKCRFGDHGAGYDYYG